MRLYNFPRSSASFRVRIALNLKGVDYETVQVSLPSDEHRGADFRALNPQATVPTIDDDGVLLAQSLAIIEYLDARFPEPRLIPAEPVARARVQWLAQLVACEIHPLNNLRVRRHLASDLRMDGAGVERWQRHWIEEGFGPLEALVRQWSGGRYSYGDAVSLADVYLVPQVYNARRVACDLTPYPTLVRVADALALEPAFARAAPTEK